MTNRTKVIN